MALLKRLVVGHVQTEFQKMLDNAYPRKAKEVGVSYTASLLESPICGPFGLHCCSKKFLTKLTYRQQFRAVRTFRAGSFVWVAETRGQVSLRICSACLKVELPRMSTEIVSRRRGM